MSDLTFLIDRFITTNDKNGNSRRVFRVYCLEENQALYFVENHQGKEAIPAKIFEAGNVTWLDNYIYVTPYYFKDIAALEKENCVSSLWITLKLGE